MANTVLGEKREGDARIRSRGGIPVLEETYSFIVRADSKNESRINILNTTGLPIVGVTVSAYGYSVCRTKDAKRRKDNPLIWDVTCDFSSEVEERQSSYDPQSDPNVWIPVYETKSERLSELVTRDVNDVAIANSAGDPFPNGLTITRKIPVWEFFQFESASISDETIVDRCDVVNASTFKGRAAKTCLLDVMSSVIGYYYGARRRLTQYSIKYNERTWVHKRQDVGERYLSGPTKIAFTADVEGDEDSKAVCVGALNGTGGPAAAGDPPAILDFDVYRDISFSFLRV
jgi:hypothetical protein